MASSSNGFLRSAVIRGLSAIAVLLGLMPFGFTLAQFCGPVSFSRAVAAQPASEPHPLRVAILHFGPPKEWNGEAADMVGVTIDPDAWKAAVPLLEKEHVDVVVVRMNSGGGIESSVPRFHDVFEHEFKPRFRTVAWIDSGLVDSALCALPIEEWYFAPDARFGWVTCAGWGDVQCGRRTGAMLEERIEELASASRMGHRDPALGRALMIYEPLSADIDDSTGIVALRQDESGTALLNRQGRVFSLDAKTARRVHLSRGTVASREELADALGVGKVEWAGDQASASLDKSMRDLDADYKAAQTLYRKFSMSIALAERETVSTTRVSHISDARKHFAALRPICEAHPGLAQAVGVCKDWLEQQAEYLDRLGQHPTK